MLKSLDSGLRRSYVPEHRRRGRQSRAGGNRPVPARRLVRSSSCGRFTIRRTPPPKNEAPVPGRRPQEKAMRRDTLILQARYVFPVEGLPIEDGVVVLQQGRIGWVGPARERAGDLDLGNVAIMPGLVNAHTHLELASLDATTTPSAQTTVENEV